MKAGPKSACASMKACPCPPTWPPISAPAAVLGDKYISLEGGTSGAPLLQDGQRLVVAKVPIDLDQVMSSIGQVADDIKTITASLKVSLASPESQQNIKEALANINDISASLKVVVADNQQRLDQIIANLDRFTGDLSSISSENKDALSKTIQNFAVASDKMEQTMVSLNSVLAKIDQGKGSIGQLVNNDKTIRELNDAITSLNEVSQKINEGKGTIGRLVNDDTTIDKIDEALTGINDYIGRADAWHLMVDYRGEYMFQQEALRSELNVIFQPRVDKFYLVGVVDNPIGKRRETITETKTNIDGVESIRKVHQITIDKDDMTFNAQIGKRFYDLIVRAGLFESKGGFGVDYMLYDDDLRVTAELYDFRTDEKPHLKLRADYKFLKYFYVTAGYDDVFNDYGQGTAFLGGGFFFSDDDLKFLLTSAPMP